MGAAPGSIWSSDTWLPARGRPVLCRALGCRAKALDETAQLCRYHQAAKVSERNERRRHQRAIASLPDLQAPDWAELGACYALGPALFFAEDAPSIKAAKAVCQACPMREVCLAMALRDRHFGTWGGTTEKERERMRLRESA